MQIYKYPLAVDTDQMVEIPGPWAPLHVGEQAGQLFLWASVTPGGTYRDRTIFVRGTGDEAPDAEHLGTVQIGAYVWHVFAADYPGHAEG